MKKIKDFIYDTNDILIALIILAVAAGIIFWRMDVIMNYPKVLLGTEDLPDYSTVQDDNTAQDTKMPEAMSEEEQSQMTGDENNDIEETTPDNAIWGTDGKLSERVVVDIEGNSAIQAVECLIDKKLFEDYDDYVEICDTLSLDPEKVAAGRFTFEVGTTKEQIAKKINWG